MPFRSSSCNTPEARQWQVVHQVEVKAIVAIVDIGYGVYIYADSIGMKLLGFLCFLLLLLPPQKRSKSSLRHGTHDPIRRMALLILVSS